MSSLVKGIGGILAALLIFAGEQYIQHHFWPDKPPQQAQGPDGDQHQSPLLPEVIPIDGRVIDAGGTRVIENASVELAIGPIHESESTDTEGRYAFSLQGFDPQTAASMTIEASGYKRFTANLLLSSLEQDKEQKLEAQAPTAPGHLGIGAVVRSVYVGPGDGQAKVPAQLKYVRRIDPKVLVAHN
jgi:hypothetical protein